MPEQKHLNVLYGIGSIGDEGVNDYIWQNFIVSDYPYSVLPAYGINNMQMMNTPYYPQGDSMYSNMVNGNFGMHYSAVYNNYPQNVYVEPMQKSKKYDTSMRKLKNQV